MAAKKKKAGRPRKERPEDKQEFWEKALHDHRLGSDRAAPKWLVWEWKFRDENGPPLERVAKAQSFTQQSCKTISYQLELAVDECVVLSPPWLRYLEYMGVAAEALSPEDNGAALKEEFLQDARSRHQERPIEIPAEAPSPSEMRSLLSRGELKVSLKSDRRRKIIEIMRVSSAAEYAENHAENG